MVEQTNIKIFINLNRVLMEGVSTLTSQISDFNLLNWSSEGRQLWNFIKHFNPTVFTELQVENWTKLQKLDWCKSNLGENIEVICCTKIKEYSTINSKQILILIDDETHHKLQWKGVFIHYINSQDTIDYLKNVIFSVNVLFIGDPHFKIKNVEYIPLFISKVLKVVNEYKLDFVVVAGDLLDNHDRVDVEPLNLAIEFINLLRKQIKTFILVGNHDYKNNQQFLTNHHWMNSLKYWDNVVIVDNVTHYTIKNTEFVFVPYVPPGRFIEALETKFEKENFKNFKGIFAHQEFYGCKMGPIKSKEGDKWSIDWPLVISGHIHNKQWCQQNIYYPGSAMQHAFGQSIENTVSILSFYDGMFHYEEIDLKMPKLSIKYMSIQDIMQPLDKYKNKKYKKYKLVLQGTNEEFQTFKKSTRYKELLNDNFKITFKIKNKLMVEDMLKTKKKFIDILNEKIKEEEDPELESLLQQLLI